MNYKHKEKKLSPKVKKRIETLLGVEEWNNFYEDRFFGGELFEEVNSIEKEKFERRQLEI